jgi:hypothetical protein
MQRNRMPIRDARLTHGLDIAWIIVLWKALHGGDPSPETVAAEVIAALSEYLECAPDACDLNVFNRHVC